MSAKPSRNDRCPCGSGKKYKACCQAKDRARAQMASVVGADAFAAAEAVWNQAAREAGHWEADVIPIRAGLRDGPDTAPSLAMVVAAGFAVHVQVVPRRPESVGQRARMAAEAVAAAGRAVGTLPGRVHVRDGSLAAALAGEPELRGVAVEAAPLPGLDEALSASLAHLAENPVMARLSTPASWAETEASPGALADFHAAAAEFYRAEPWLALGDDPFFLRFPDGSGWAASLMGGAGVQFGVALYSDAGDLLEMLDGDLSAEEHFTGLRGCTLTASLDAPRELTRAMRREVAAAGWPLAAPGVYPRLYGVHLPEWRVTAAHVETAALALRAVARLARGEDPADGTGVGVSSLLAEEDGALA